MPCNFSRAPRRSRRGQPGACAPHPFLRCFAVPSRDVPGPERKVAWTQNVRLRTVTSWETVFAGLSPRGARGRMPAAGTCQRRAWGQSANACIFCTMRPSGLQLPFAGRGREETCGRVGLGPPAPEGTARESWWRTRGCCVLCRTTEAAGRTPADAVRLWVRLWINKSPRSSSHPSVK